MTKPNQKKFYLIYEVEAKNIKQVKQIDKEQKSIMGMKCVDILTQNNFVYLKKNKTMDLPEKLTLEGKMKELEILNVFKKNKYKRLAINEICKYMNEDVGLGKDMILSYLRNMNTKGLVEAQKITGSVEKKWSITPLGKKLLKGYLL